MNQFTVTTKDGVTIAAITTEPSEISKRILCLPMMPATKESYIPFMAYVADMRWQCWAIDFRGHGASTQNGRLNFETFTDEQHQQYGLDVEATLTEMKKSGPVDAIIGASIGANFAAIYQQKEHIAKSVLLSPGLDYYGVKPQVALSQLTADQSVNLVATTEDMRKNGQSAEVMARSLLETITHAHKLIEIYPGKEHGTDIINHPGRTQRIVQFLTT